MKKCAQDVPKERSSHVLPVMVQDTKMCCGRLSAMFVEEKVRLESDARAPETKHMLLEFPDLVLQLVGTERLDARSFKELQRYRFSFL